MHKKVTYPTQIGVKIIPKNLRTFEAPNESLGSLKGYVFELIGVKMRMLLPLYEIHRDPEYS